jgi:hypothetical protein
VALPDFGEIGWGKTRPCVLHEDACFVVLDAQGPA